MAARSARAQGAPVRLPLPYDHVHMPALGHLTDYHPPRSPAPVHKFTVQRSGLDYSGTPTRRHAVAATRLIKRTIVTYQ